MVTCNICGKTSHSLTSHIRVHKLTSLQYKEMFPESSLISENLNKRRRETNLKKYGSINVSGNSKILEKKRNTSLRKYGEEHYNKTQEAKDRYKKTCISKYKVTNPSQVEEFKQRKINTCMKHFGVPNPRKSEEVIEKGRNTNLRKCGKIHEGQTELGKEKRRNTNLQRYGGTNPMHSPIIARKNFLSGVKGISNLERKIINLNIPKLINCEHHIAIKFSNNRCKYPDFIVEGQKKVIEVNGYFHYPQFVNQTKEEHSNWMITNYKKQGYDCLVIWDDDIKNNLALIKEKILSFISSETICQASNDEDIVQPY